jgi:hypothetical protein
MPSFGGWLWRSGGQKTGGKTGQGNKRDRYGFFGEEKVSGRKGVRNLFNIHSTVNMLGIG